MTSAVSVILPVFNEERAVAAEIQEIRRVLQSRGIPHEVIVVDDGSADRSAEHAAAAGATVIRHVENRGYGAAIKTGMRAARHDTIVITDADGTYPADQIPELLARMDDADMVVGARTGANVHIPLIRRPAKWVLNWVAARVAGSGKPGEVLAISDEGITIAGNGGAILAKRVKAPDTKKIGAAEWAKAVGLAVGDVCAAPQPKAPT